MSTDLQKGKTIQSVQRAIDILNCFSLSNTELSLGEISSMLGLNKGTAYGLISTLYNNDYLCQNRSGKYLLGSAVFSKAIFQQNTLMALYADAARARMQEISNKFLLTGNLFHRGMDFLQFVLATEPRNSFFLLHKARPEMPMYAAASGKLFLAYMDNQERDQVISELELNRLTKTTIVSQQELKRHLNQIRTQGYSLEQDEFFEGVSAISVPVLLKDDKLFGTISMTGMSTNIAEHREAIVSDLIYMAFDVGKVVEKFRENEM